MTKFKPFSLNIKGKLLEISSPQVMGIINVTPDSFYSQSRSIDSKSINFQIDKMLDEGVDIIDLGAYSSRPGANDVSSQEEMMRLETAMNVIKPKVGDIPISIDTFRADVAEYAIETLGAHIINDISGGLLDKQMISTVARLKVPYIAMHMRGNPITMNDFTRYKDVSSEVIYELSEQINKLALAGVNDIIIDPGFGFSKTVEQNYELLRNLEAFHNLGYPVLVGISRKSMIYKPLNTSANEALNGTTVLNTLALQSGAAILRVHDVKAAREAIKLTQLTYS